MSLEWHKGKYPYKYKVIVKTARGSKTVNFGRRGYQQYKDSTPLKLYSADDHLDPSRRKNYRARHRGILLRDGTPAYKKKYSPAWFSYYYLW